MVYGGYGFEYVVPLVAKENQDRTDPQGIIFSKGFIPHQFKNSDYRPRIEDVSRQTFIGFVSTLEELQNNSIWSGNAYQDGRLHYSCADL